MAVDSSSCDAGVRAAAAVIGLGKLQRQEQEFLVIEACNEAGQTPKDSVYQNGLEEVPVHLSAEKSPAERRLEDDLVLQDCDSDDEVLYSSCASSSMGRFTARRLMQARAQSCMVCMEEKEHTFVPEHLSDNVHHVQGHRFCSDCWVDFLDHSLSATRKGVVPALTCPLCRSDISVPDFWTVDVELPASWVPKARREIKVSSEVAVLTSTAGMAASEQHSWVDDIGSVASSQIPAADDCTPVNGRGTAPVCRRVWDSAVRQGVAS
eukprot:TRINITY_DN13171_c0_g1_i1.p1 TRINITY_DN13171_c0_g1~~TRINITY_DN13171_c0_g1_i1.p1  ORF type:complete len:283 (+),score=54.07 TRINITY_DN13171_c0_g1_i1:56-850(+)